jgi:hypothetical protein
VPGKGTIPGRQIIVGEALSAHSMMGEIGIFYLVGQEKTCDFTQSFPREKKE